MTNFVNVNILSYDSNNMTLVVNFTNGPDTTANVVVQPHVYQTTDKDELMRLIATTGYNMLLSEQHKKRFKANTEIDAHFKSLVNSSITLTTDEILDAAIQNNGLEVQI